MILVYLQIAIHINAVGLGAMTLLGHATWLLAQLLLTAVPWIFESQNHIGVLGQFFPFAKRISEKKHILRMPPKKAAVGM